MVLRLVRFAPPPKRGRVCNVLILRWFEIIIAKARFWRASKDRAESALKKEDSKKAGSK
jgi:hypothetical protein